MPHIVLGLAFIAFGAISIYDALRIGAALRARGTLDIVGPDRYLFGVAVLLVVVGACLIVQAWTSRRVPRHAGAARVAPAAGIGGMPADADVAQGRAHLWLFAALLAYVALLPLLGYLVATVLFAIAAFRVMGVRSMLRAAVAAVLLTAVCYGSFVLIADLPLPRGVLGI